MHARHLFTNMYRAWKNAMCTGTLTYCLYEATRPKEYAPGCVLIFVRSTGWFYPYRQGVLHLNLGNQMTLSVPAEEVWGIVLNKWSEFTNNV